MGKELWKNVGALAGAALFMVVVSALAIWGMVGWLGMSYSDSARLFQAVGAVTVIFVGGMFAYWRLQIFRTFEPHLTISHEVSHRFIGDSYVHIAVTANLHNSSRVKIELRRAFFSLQMIAPVSDTEIEYLFEDTFVKKEESDIQWTTLAEIQREWIENELIVEPDESHQEACEFIVSSGVESAVIYTYFYNPASSQNTQSADGWSATTVHDIVNLD